ncbi:hypothetical protein BC939DRAFT_446802 [Gamsiella multidivaricata]|uniref:uncharacterized protein n=1 Tax=Gamsiella multidivaricata TaxID=101098 RepID=UPI0022205E94|nr:uncharacterized protein BC939DRAFT_446802 [Gamsiella multidivaricata]KAI7826570.1 hypothetical protein BC939DRAFT_446802 [Gamsiella multidivaricata]
MLARNHNDLSARHHLDSNNTSPASSQTHAPYRPHRAKRAIPDPTGASPLRPSLSQLSLFDDHSSVTHVSLPSSPSTASLASSLAEARPLESGIDLQEAPRPLNRRSNRDFRVIPAAEIEVMNETNLQESIRHSKSAQKNTRQQQQQPQPQQQKDASVCGAQYQPLQLQLQSGQSGSKLNDKSPILEVDEEESYFGDILDKYCNNSDDDPTSPITASPTSPFSKAPGWKTFNSPQPPTPPVSRSFNLPETFAPPRRERTGAGAPTPSSTRNSKPSSSSGLSSQDSSHLYQERSWNNSNPGISSASSSPINAASAKLHMYQHASTASDSRESLTKLNASSSTSSARAYTKRLPPPPKDVATESFSKNASDSSSPVYPTRGSSSSAPPSSHQQETRSTGRSHPQNHHHLDQRETRPEPPPKDISRRIHNTNSNSTGKAATTASNDSSSNISSQPPKLSLDTHPSGHFNSFSDVVEASISQRKGPSSATSPTSMLSYKQEPLSQPYAHHQSSPRPRTNSTQTHSSTTSSQGTSRSLTQQSHQAYGQSGWNEQEQNQRYNQGHGQGQGQDRGQGSRDQSRHGHHGYDQDRHAQHYQSHQHQKQHPHSQHQDGLHRMHGSTSQLDLTASGRQPSAYPASVPSRSSSQPTPFLNERARSYSQGSVSTTSSATRSGYPGSSRGLKSALVKTPIARARAKEVHGPRKVLFGEMITVVTIERAETPPPAPPLDKKAKKKLIQAKKSASKNGKGGQMQNFDPEYNAAYFNSPYTPTPAEVVVTLAPWIGNPNYDEEKQNSKFYYDDEYDHEYDDEEYEAPYQSDIRLGPEDDEDDEDEDDEDEDEDEEYRARAWGHGIAGPGGALPKKKGGMFKFKRAVNKLLHN